MNGAVPPAPDPDPDLSVSLASILTDPGPSHVHAIHMPRAMRRAPEPWTPSTVTFSTAAVVVAAAAAAAATTTACIHHMKVVHVP
ncbi:hypothetical protein MRS44_000377 [Fusarium solani]|uniref:uncharacterized protein n=1 Tax=Fusarium solani TaxID=169388 RepID=UPI0032C424F4|nr:hypothetical protein MRS44_000377 [Fusarium solani]